MLFQVDYALKDVEAYKAAGKAMPKYVVASSVADAVAAASSYESENATLLSCDLKVSDGMFVITETAKGAV